MKKTKKQTLQKVVSEDDSKMIMASMNMVSAKSKFNIYQKRIELYLENEAQVAIQGERDIAGRKIPADGMHPIVEIPLREILQDEDDSNYTVVKRSAKAITSKVIEYTDKDGTWIVISPVISVKIPKYSSTMSVEVHRDMWNAILDYRKGWRKFDYRAAMGFKCVHSITLYRHISLHSDFENYSVDGMKDFFGVKDKYKLTADFIRYVLEPVKKELDTSSPWSFDYDINRVSDKPQSKIIGFTIKPYPNGVRAIEADRNESMKKIHLSNFIPNRQIRKYLLDSIGFTQAELCGKKNKRLFAVIYSIMPDTLLDLLVQLRAKSREKKKPKGWIISALNGKVDDYYKSIGKPNPLKEENAVPASDTLPLDFDDIANDIASSKKLKC